MNILKTAKKIAAKYGSDLNNADHWGFTPEGDLKGPPTELSPGDVILDKKTLRKAIFIGLSHHDPDSAAKALIHYLKHNGKRESLTKKDNEGYQVYNVSNVPLDRLELVEKRK